MTYAGIGHHYYSPRHREAREAFYSIGFNNLETQEIRELDRENLEPMADAIHEFRGPAGFRWANGERIDSILKAYDIVDAHKLIALNEIYCEKYGEVDELTGRGDPLALIKDLERVAGVAAWGHNRRIEQLAAAAIVGQNPQLAAALLKAAGEGIGVDDKMVEAILIKSKKTMDKPTHASFMAETAKVFQEITHPSVDNPGESLDDFIAREYAFGKKTAFVGGAVVGAVIGGIMGGVIGSLVVGTAIALLAKAFTETGITGVSSNGEQYQNILDKSRRNSHNTRNSGLYLRSMMRYRHC